MSKRQSKQSDSPERGSNKSRKFAGSSKYDTSYNKEWEKEYPVQSVHGESGKFRCVPCQRVLACKHQGLKDIKLHCETDAHGRAAEAAKTQTKLAFTTVGQITSTQKLAHRAEAKTVEFVVQHNLSIRATDHLIPLYREMFHDSQIAKSMSCARTKSTCILNLALQPESHSSLVDYMTSNPYSIATDGSNDNGLEKMNPVIVTIFDVNRSSKVEIKFFNMCMTSGEDAGKASAIFAAIDKALTDDGIPWCNCVAVGVDNTNTNIGAHNSIKSRALAYNSDIYFNGCPCHLSHISASNGHDAYANCTGFNAEDFCVDLYFWFDKSTKRKGQLNEFYEFCDIEYANLVRHVSVRWLSLEQAIRRALEKHDGLKSYFISNSQNDTRFKRIKEAYKNDPKTEIHLLVLSSILPLFTHFTLLLQREDPCIHLLHPTITSLCRKISQRLIKPQVLAETSPLDIDLSDDANYLYTDDIFLGLIAKQKLTKALESGDISDQDVQSIRSGAHAFYKASLSYIYKKFPLNEPVVVNAVWIDVLQRMRAKFDQVEVFLIEFSGILKDLDQSRLYEEFVDYQTLSDEEIGVSAFKEATTREADDDNEAEYRQDVLWYHLGNMTEPGTKVKRFGLLAKVARLVLIIPHSNAGSERVFSIVRVQKTDQRNKLEYDGTLASALTVKMDRPDHKDSPCYKYEPSAKIIERVPKVTREYNLQHTGTK